MKQRTYLVWLLSFVFLALLVPSCNRNSKVLQSGDAEYAATGEPVDGDWIVVHELSDPEGMNPYTTSDASATTLFKNIFEGLIKQNWATGVFEPCLASKMPELSDDHLTYTFTLRKDATFSDGHPLTVQDVLFSFKAIKNPLVVEAAPLRGYFEDLDRVEILNDSTFQVIMRKPYFMAEIQIGDLRILPKHKLDPKNLTDQYTFAETNDTSAFDKNKAMSEFAEWFGGNDCKRSKDLLLGTGPYKLGEWKTAEYIMLDRNEKYWNKEWAKNVHPQKIAGRVINDRPAAVSAIKSGDLDFIEYVPPMMYDELIDTAKLSYLKKDRFESISYSYIGWNTERDIFKDRRTRQALSHFVDRDQMIKTIMRGFAVKMDGPIYRNRPEYDSAFAGYDFNPTKANALLKEAGWSDSNGDGILDIQVGGKRSNFEFTILVNAGNEIRQNIGVVLSNELKKHGIICKVQPIEWSIFLQTTRTHNFDAYIGAWVNDNIPTDLYQLWHSSAIKGGSNYVSFSTPRTDELIVKNRVEFDEAKRFAMMREIQTIFQQEQPYTFLWTPQFPTVYNKRLRNVKFYGVRPGYNYTEWFVPKGLQVYSGVH